MKNLCLQFFLYVTLLVPFLTGRVHAAEVPPAGYTNDFAAIPLASDWATSTRPGAAGDNYDMDSDVNATIAADAVVATVLSDAGNPVAANANAAWSSTGFYLQTRPTGNRFTALVGKFVNNTGTNATQIGVSYLFTIAAGGINEEAARGTRVYVSVAGTTNSWSNIAALNTTASANGSSTLSATAPVNWTNGGVLYLLIADDNASGFGTDAADQYDNFSLRVTAGTPVAPPVIVTILTPTNGMTFLGPSSIPFQVSATSTNLTVTNVEFWADGAKLGEDATSPYAFNWSNPALGPHVLTAVAMDNLGGARPSEPVNILVFNSAGAPFSRVTSPTNGFIAEGPTNLAVTAQALALDAVTNVQFYANGVEFGSDATAPYSVNWNAPFGTNTLTAVVAGANGLRGTSAVTTVRITIPPTNTVAPTIATQSPLAGSTLSNLTSVTITFSERVQGVDAADLLINGTPATSVSGSISNYTFTFPQPAYGEVSITWATNHGITDFGFPTNLPFNRNALGASWSYDLEDHTAPTIVARNPAAGVTINTLTTISVTFSEPVSGVDAGDLLLNGTPAFGLTGSGSNYTFSVSQPAGGAVSVTWAANHGITDLASAHNPFNATGAGATWTYTIDNRTVLVQSNANWLFLKGNAEASTPNDAWRQPGFNDSSWSNAPAPFFYGDPYSNGVPAFTLLYDMQSNYSTIYLRSKFTVGNAAAITNLFFNFQIDDGLVAWINGVEVFRFNAPAGEVPYNGLAPSTATEGTGGPGGNGGANYINTNLPNPSLYLVNGENVLAVHALNQALASSSDFGFNAQLYTFIVDLGTIAPRISSITPSAGTVLSLTNITVQFTEPVSGVNASDLLINGVPATGVSSTTNTTYTFQFAKPAFGTVNVTWAAAHGIQDFDSPPKAFDATAPGSTFTYSFLNPSAPTVASQSPVAGASINNLTQVTVTFSEGVTGVNASDLLINGVAATGLSGGPSIYTFTFAQPAAGIVSVGWAANHGITDLEVPANAFDSARSINSWTYTLVDQTPPVIASKTPPAGAPVTNLTSLTVTFSEPVSGVNAADLLINSNPATGVTGGPTTYVFTFPQPNATVVNITWANAHGIRDLATVPNSFDATGLGATWSYTTVDNVAPVMASLVPPAGATVRSLSSISVLFSETVVGVGTNDLLVNNQPAIGLDGSGAGPYTFNYLPPSNGLVQVRWASNHGITDLAVPPNSFAGGIWTNIVDPNASFAGSVIVNEIMFNPRGSRLADEWLELFNVSASPVSVAGWRLTKGVEITLPNVSIPANGYLVVAANVAAFNLKYPSVNNVVGGWTGSLANSDETIQLETGLGEVVHSVHYATEGDWAKRERGGGAQVVTSIVRNGSTATVTIFNHGYTAGGGFGGGTPDQVIISGADQPEYNGRFVVSGVQPSTFNITVSGTPASPATGNIQCRQALDDGFSGWSWFSAADGFGSSLELINSKMPASSGQNWLVSSIAGGTPGRVNSVSTNDAAPLILDVTHAPAIPRSTEPVGITARLRDELSNGVASVTLFYRTHSSGGPGAFVSTNMFDDGAHADGIPNDGLFGAVLPATANGTVIEFYLQATDIAGHARTWPAPATETNGVTGQFANALYQVDDENITNLTASIRLVLSGTERASFPPSNRNGDAAMNATLVSQDGEGTKIRYLSSVRVRGAGTRMRTPPNNRINIPNDNRWNGLKAINLNGQYPHAQLVANALAQKSGVLATDARAVQYRINGVNPALLTAPTTQNGSAWGLFLLMKPVNGDLAADWFPNDGGGNVYRASSSTHLADFTYADTNLDSYISRGYYKASNQAENDWSDILSLTYAFSQVVPNADYVQAIRTNVNVVEWMRYFALCSLLNDGETKLGNGIGDDFALYRGDLDRRFQVIGHDFDTVLGQGDTGANYYPVATNSSIFIMLNPPNNNGSPATLQTQLNRFMKHPEFAPIFYGELKRLAETTFSPAQLEPLFDQLLTGIGLGPDASTITAMKNYTGSRRAYVLSQIPLNLTIASSLPTQNGYLAATTPNVTLFGNTHAVDTRKVLVNGLPATWSAWEARWTNTIPLQPGLNRVLVQSLNSNDVEFARATVDIWYDDASVQSVSGAIAADTAWTAANGPYQVTANVTVNSGATLTIQAGTTVYLNSGVNIVVANGGKIIAEGTETAHIRFTRAPGTSGNWGNITINGAVGSPESRIAYADFEFNANNTGTPCLQVTAGTVFFDHLTFANTAAPYIHVDGASFVIRNCYFPTATAQFELVHGTQGVKAGGRAIVERCFFGKPTGYNDTVDFTGGNRPGPIIQFLNNVFVGSDDDILDLDSTDAWVEGNIFLHSHKNGSPDSSSAISGGADNADTSQITIVGNIIYDCDNAANGKQGNFYTMINNTIVHQSHTGGTDTNGAVALLSDVGTAEGLGMYLEGNIIYDAEKLAFGQTAAVITFTNNLITQLQGAPWTGPGGNNTTNVEPLFKHLPTLAETTNFTSWGAAQVMWDWFSLLPGSPARGTGPNGRDRGGVIPFGASISGEPVGVTAATTATLTVGFNRTGNAIPTNGFPNGSGFSHYKWRLDGGAWSAETPIANPINLGSLVNGPHFVEVSGKNDAGFYQDDPAFGADAVVTASRTWTVNTTASALRLNEVLAANTGVLDHNGTTPDAIELYNSGSSALNLSGYRLSTSAANTNQFIFPVGATIPARGYLTVYADNPNGTPGYHVGFNLRQGGETLNLYNSVANGGGLIDSVVFGPQLDNLSIGRLADGTWTLTTPTFGSVNRAAPTGDPNALRLNEWLAIGITPFANDFVEIYNTDARPVALGGLYLSDEILSWPDRHKVTPLSFIPGNGYFRFFADGNANQGADHLNFNLNPDQGAIALYGSDLSIIDCVLYQAQFANGSQGRSPNGSAKIVYFTSPTPGSPNPTVTGPPPFGGALVINEVLANNASLADGSRTNDWIEIYNGTTNAVNLANLSLSDDTLLSRRFVFGDMTVPANGRFRVLFGLEGDSIPANAVVNSAFGLKANGGGVYLFDSPAAGGGLLNSIVYGLQPPNLSIGRVPDGSTNWVLTSPTPGSPNIAIPTLGNVASLKVNEWLADPVPGDDDWFEIYNPTGLPVALGGLNLTDDLNDRVKHTIAPLSFLGTGPDAFQKFVADANTGAGANHVGFSLRGTGEAIGLSTANGTLIDGVTFGLQQQAVSQGRFPDGGTNVLSFPGTASPGGSNWRRLAQIVISEVVTHTQLPLEDAIELQNVTSTPVDVGGWWLSDDDSVVQKYQIPPGTVISAGGFVVIYETHFTNRNEAAIPFALSSQGDEIVLAAASGGALTGFRARQDFGAQLSGVSFGRYVTSDGREEFVAMSKRTFGVDDPANVQQFRTGTGASNAYPRVGPVVISEIMYHPTDIGTNDNVEEEFIELHNITTAPVSLYDPANPTAVWHLRNAVDFDFPLGTIIPPGSYMLIVSFDPIVNTNTLAQFRARYNVPVATPVVGPYSGKLGNDTDDLELRRPDAPDLGVIPYVLVERVHYSHGTPWPAQADGTGLSLQRISDALFGDDPANWTAGLPTAGPATPSLDSDQDGMPDAWELANGFDPHNPLDAALDADGDRLTNLQEYLGGSDPRNNLSGIAFTSVTRSADQTVVVLTFTAFANQSYSLEAADQIIGPWLNVQDVPPASAIRTVEVALPITGGAKFFRLRTPWSYEAVNGLQFNSIQRAANKNVLLTFTVPANQAAIVEFKATLPASSWTAVTNFPASGVLRVLQVTTPATNASGFYRLRSP